MFASFFGNKYEEAAELLEKACNNYKLAKAWGKAAEGFELLADCHLKSDSKHDAATACVEAANAHKKVNPTEAVRCLLAAVGHYTDMGRLSIAAKHLKDVAEVREKEDDVEGALAAYVQAADLFAGEENVSTANGCKLKVAELSATAERYQVAIDAFEEVAKASMGNNLLKFSVKGYLLNAGICRLCAQEPVGGEERARALRGHRPYLRGGKGGEAFGGAGGCRGTGRPGWIRRRWRSTTACPGWTRGRPRCSFAQRRRSRRRRRRRRTISRERVRFPSGEEGARVLVESKVRGWGVDDRYIHARSTRLASSRAPRHIACLCA